MPTRSHSRLGNRRLIKHIERQFDEHARRRQEGTPVPINATRQTNQSPRTLHAKDLPTEQYPIRAAARRRRKLRTSRLPRASFEAGKRPWLRERLRDSQSTWCQSVKAGMTLHRHFPVRVRHLVGEHARKRASVQAQHQGRLSE